jgi:hypothetical protein
MAAVINEVEGYLLYQAELRTADKEAEAFVRRMPWLTTAQREEVARHYADQRIELSKEVLRAIATRCEELRAEYTARYESLRQRLMCVSTAALITSASLCVSTFVFR